MKWELLVAIKSVHLSSRESIFKTWSKEFILRKWDDHKVCPITYARGSWIFTLASSFILECMVVPSGLWE